MLFASTKLIKILSQIEIAYLGSNSQVTKAYDIISDIVLIVHRTKLNVLYNNSAISSLGHPNVINRNFMDLIHSEDRSSIDLLFYDASRDLSREVICRFQTGTGSFVHTESCCKIGLWNGLDVFYVCMRNVEHRMEAFDAKFAAESHVSKIQNNSLLVTGLAHDLRTPLSIFQMALASENITLTRSPLLYLNYILERTIECCRVLNGEKPQPSYRFAELGTILDNVKQTLEFYPSSVQIHFTMTLDENIHSVLCDALWMQSILVSYIANALDNTLFGDINVVVSNDQQWIRFEVIDTGAGIEPHLFQYLFRPFSKLNSKTHYDHGLGLGLFNVSWRARLMNGIYGVKANPTGGSIFYCNIPIRQEVVQSLTEKRPSIHQQYFGTLRILVAEDTVMFRRLLVIQLKKHGFTDIVECENGADALNKLKSTVFDVAVVDYYMPLLNGDAVIEQYKKWLEYSGRTGTTRFILMSADVLSEEMQRKFAFVQKPIQFEVLTRMIQGL